MEGVKWSYEPRPGGDSWVWLECPSNCSGNTDRGWLDAPTGPGYWWSWRGHGTAHPPEMHMITVCPHTQKLRVYFYDHGVYYRPEEFPHRLWFGPIEPPELPVAGT